MARGNGKAKQVDIEEAIEERNDTERRKNSELTDDEKRALLFIHKREYQATLEAKKKADAEFKNACKLAKAECGKNAVADIKDLIALETPEGEAAHKDEIERKLRVARWAASPLGTQFQFFESGGPAVDAAFEAGKTAALDGKDRSPPHDPSVPQYTRWIEGWDAGQEILLSDFRDKIARKEDVEAEPREPLDLSDVPFRPADDPAVNEIPA